MNVADQTLAELSHHCQSINSAQGLALRQEEVNKPKYIFEIWYVLRLALIVEELTKKGLYILEVRDIRAIKYWVGVQHRQDGGQEWGPIGYRHPRTKKEHDITRLGHAHIKTTMRYSHVAPEHLHRAVHKLYLVPSSDEDLT